MENQQQEWTAPVHVSIIMDGNGRWAKSKGMPRTYGHNKGAQNVVDICEDAFRLGIRYLTLYAFSTENWNRPAAEVKALMYMFGKYLKICRDRSMETGTRVRIIGDRTRLSGDLQSLIQKTEEDTRHFTEHNLQIAINYGSRDEMIRGMRRMLADYGEGKFTADELDEARFSTYLDTADIPDPDLMIRTSGEQRLSNYLLWQHAYSEFYFTDVPWPEFDKNELIKAMIAYTNRDRRYGKITES